MKFAPFTKSEAIELTEEYSYLILSKTSIDGEVYKIKAITITPFEEDKQIDVFRRFQLAFNPTNFMQPSFDDAMKYIFSCFYGEYDVFLIATRKAGKTIDVKFVPLMTFVSDKGEFDQGFELSLHPDYQV